MYEVLVAHLRECEKLDPSNNTYKEAADAIEELSADCDMYRKGMTYERNKAARLLWYKEHCWIPVTERLPERHKNVLCCGARGGMFVGWFTNISVISDGKTIAYVHGGNGRYVTHWMSLPQPPKEE